VERALQEGPVQLDLGAIDRVDSAALALIVSLLRKDKRKHHIRFQNVPATIVNFAEIYGLEDVLSTHLPQ
jgi:ABC-type transporter Mla MlaB component